MPVNYLVLGSRLYVCCDAMHIQTSLNCPSVSRTVNGTVSGQNPTGQNPTGQNPTGQNPTGQSPSWNAFSMFRASVG